MVGRMRKDTRRRVIETLLRKVAATYPGNIEMAPTTAVAEAFDLSYQTAGDCVRQACDRHYLGESIKLFDRLCG